MDEFCNSWKYRKILGKDISSNANISSELMQTLRYGKFEIHIVIQCSREKTDLFLKHRHLETKNIFR